VEPLQGGLLSGNKDIHVIAARAMVRDGKQRVRVGWQVHTDDLCLLVAPNGWTSTYPNSLSS
jgi:hypothetical protein